MYIYRMIYFKITNKPYHREPKASVIFSSTKGSLLQVHGLVHKLCLALNWKCVARFIVLVSTPFSIFFLKHKLLYLFSWFCLYVTNILQQYLICFKILKISIYTNIKNSLYLVKNTFYEVRFSCYPYILIPNRTWWSAFWGVPSCDRVNLTRGY